MNILIVGFGSIAKKHLAALYMLDISLEVYALRSAQSAPKIDGVANIYNLQECTKIKFDFAIISNPTKFHYTFISQLAEMSIPLFIEKPPLASLIKAQDLADKIKSLKIKTYVACNMRFHPCLKFLKQHIESNPNKKINELNVYCGSYLPDWRPDQDFRKNYSANKEMGGGVHLDLFHELDYTYWIFGQPNEVFSIKKCVSSLKINAYDYANYLLTYNTFTATIILNYYRRDAKRSIEIVFEDQTWTIDLLSNRIVDSNGSLIYTANEFNIAQTYFDQMKSFITFLNDDEAPQNSFGNSLEVLKICLHNE